MSGHSVRCPHREPTIQPEPAPKKSIQPAIFDLVFLTWAVVIPLVFPGRLINSDGDLARHLRLGSHMLDHRAFIREDFFSWSKAGEPFVAFEWLSEIIYATVHRLSGLAGIAIFAGLLLAFTYALLVRFLLRRDVDPMLAYLVGMLAAIVGAIHWLARPHLVTFLAVVLLLSLLERRSPAKLWLYGLLFAIWANLHGGFLFGLVLIGIYFAGSLAEALTAEEPEPWRERVRHYGLALVIGTAATVLNPNGIGLLTHVVTFMGEDFLHDVTNEFMSPNFHLLSGKIFLFALVLVMAGLGLSRRRPIYPRLFMILANVAFALLAMRNIAIFGLTVLPVLALHIDPEWRRLRDIGGVRAVFARDEARRTPGRWAAGLAVVLVLLGLNRGSVGPVQVVPDTFDERIFPVEAVELARAEGIEGNMFHEFIWGGYLLLQWPEQKVFIDGGTDYYGTELYREAIDIITLKPGWRDKLAQRDVSVVLVPTVSVLGHELIRDPEWRVHYCDTTAAILLRGRRAGPPAEAPATTDRETLWACYQATLARDQRDAT